MIPKKALYKSIYEYVNRFDCTKMHGEANARTPNAFLLPSNEIHDTPLVINDPKPCPYQTPLTGGTCCD